ncbi:MAG: OsmC-like protein [Actinomycetota bacterium]
MVVEAKELRYAVDLGESGSLRAEDGTPLEPEPSWTPEHLLLAGLVRCSLKSLHYHARRAGLEVTAARGSARTLITRRESDGRYAMLETGVELDVRLEPQPGQDELAELLAKAERDCFVGASLAVKPDYRWTVDGVAREPK